MWFFCMKKKKRNLQNPRLFRYQTFLFGFIFVFLATDFELVEANGSSAPCPQPRFTKQAPPEIYNLRNPLEATPENIKKGKLLFQVKAKPMACKHCHGITGDGNGPLAKGINPPPRNFTCAKTINGVPDGQLFWIIKNGSPETEMFAYRGLIDEQIWQIILHLRQLAQ